MSNRLVRYLPGCGRIYADQYNYLIDEKLVDSGLLNKIFRTCKTFDDKVNLLTAILLHPHHEELHEWIYAFGTAWRLTRDLEYASRPLPPRTSNREQYLPVAGLSQDRTQQVSNVRFPPSGWWRT